MWLKTWVHYIKNNFEWRKDVIIRGWGGATSLLPPLPLPPPPPARPLPPTPPPPLPTNNWTQSGRLDSLVVRLRHAFLSGVISNLCVCVRARARVCVRGRAPLISFTCQVYNLPHPYPTLLWRVWCTCKEGGGGGGGEVGRKDGRTDGFYFQLCFMRRNGDGREGDGRGGGGGGWVGGVVFDFKEYSVGVAGVWRWIWTRPPLWPRG